MASLDAEEALLKKKLENTENLEDRRELRRQLRELRNKKFEEEMKKVTASDYRPGRTKTALSNGVESSISSLGRKESVETKEDGEDVHGINHLETEEELQTLLNETPFTETEKRKKIRARIREIRNHKLGLGDPVVVRRVTSEEKPKEASSIVEKADDAGRRNYSSTVHSSRDVKEDKESEHNERSTYSSRGSYRSRQRNAEDTYITRSSKRGNDIDTESAGRFTSTAKLRSSANDNEKSSSIKENDVGIEDNKQVENQNSSNRDTGTLDKEEKQDSKGVGKEDRIEIEDEDVDEEKDEAVNEDGEEMEVDEDDVEDVVEDEGTSYEGKAVNGYGEDRINSLKDDSEDGLDDREDDREVYEDEEEIDSQSRSSASKNYDQLDKKQDIDTQDDAVDEDFVDNDEAVADEEDLEEEDYDEDGAEIGDDFVEDIVDDEEFSDNEEEDKRGNEDRQQSDIDKRDRGYSAEDADSYVEDEVDDTEPERMGPEPSEQSLKDEEYSDEENQSVDDGDYSSGGEEEGRDVSEEEPTSKEGRTMHEYSDDYSEGFSDHTATDEGSSISGTKKYDDDQDLADYEFEKQAVERRKTGASYISKVDEVFKQKEPALAEGKSFKELLKKSDRSSAEKPLGSKRGAEQVDFRTVLRSTDKGKKPGDKSSSTVEQMDFRNLLQKKVKTRTLADKDTGAEQVDFRTVLRQASISSEKKETPARKSSNAEQLDFRNVLKKQPSIKSRKLSMEDKNELIKSIRSSRDTTNAGEKAPAEKASVEKAPAEKASVEKAPAEKPGRPSLESLRQGGGVDKAKGELNKNLKEDAEGGKAQRKAGRPSLDALKKSGELGKTEDKKGVFEKTSKTKKAPTAVPPKPSAKGKVNTTSEKDELEVIEEPELIEEVEEEPNIGNDDRNAVQSSISKPQKTVVEGSSEESVPRKASIEVSSKKNVDRKSQNTGVQISSTANVEKSRSRRRNEESTKSEASKEDMQSRRVSQETEEKRSPTKSGDKRARNRRLRQDQNEAVQAQGEEVKSEKKEVKKIAETRQKSSSIERVAVVQSTSSKPTVQVIVNAKGSAEKSKADDSDEESIGARRNRRRLVRKESVEEDDEEDSGRGSGRAAVKKDQPAEEKKTVELEEKKGSSIGGNAGTDDSRKPSGVSARRDAGRTKAESEKSKETETDASKSRRDKTASLDAKLLERRRQRAMESREKKQQARSSRKAFKDQLESSAPTTNGSASPSIQRANSNMTKLLHWCQRITDRYPNVSVTNFTTSWKDGLAFCALLHNFVPDRIPFDDLSAKRPRESFELAFTAAAEEGVPQLLEVDDMVRMECPDPKSVITYIHAIYQEFVTNRR